jgi:FixJ family two-component response regulator
MAPDSSDLFIVDDDAMMRDALSVVFTLAGYRVTGFVDGETFLAVASDRTPAAVLLDLHLPAKSGLVVLRELDARSYPAPIFIVTGDSDVSSAVEAVKSGAFDYLVKPLDARRNCCARTQCDHGVCKARRKCGREDWIAGRLSRPESSDPA